MRKRARAWLGTIARRLFLDSLPAEDANPTECQLEPDHWQTIPQAAAPGEANGHETTTVKAAVENVLTEREQEVLRVTLHWYDPNSDHQRLPNDVATELAQRLGTTPENLRKIRERAMTKIKPEIIRLLGSSPIER